MILSETFYLLNVEMCYSGKLALDNSQAQNRKPQLKAI